MQGKDNPNWRGGRFWNKQKRCYMLLIDGKYIREHRYIMEQALGKPLNRNVDVGWTNGNRKDNRLANLYMVNHAASRELTH